MTGEGEGSVFGPVYSRRLGRSLGVDVLPFKACNWNCVYCQLGRTHRYTTKRQRYRPPEAVWRELERSLERMAGRKPDFITAVGSGETLLYEGLGSLIEAIKANTDMPVAVITNGSLLGSGAVQEELARADVVMPSLDAGTPRCFRRVNRPHRSLQYEDHVAGLKAFRRVYPGRIWLEVMLVKGLNDDEDSLRELSVGVAEIGPEEVHLNTPARPAAEKWVKKPDDKTLKRAAAVLGPRAWIVAEPGDRVEPVLDHPREETVMDIISRHPMTTGQLATALSGGREVRMKALLERMRNDGRIRMVSRSGCDYWCPACARFAKNPGTARRGGGVGPRRDRAK